ATARTAALPSIPRELYMDDAPVSFNDLAEEEDLEIPATLVSYPNPFTDRTEVNYSLPEETLVTVKIYDSIGNQIRTLLQASQLKGNHAAVWDGQDSWGNPASTGMYIIKLQAGTQIRSIRVIKK
ncbi:T9SS type A sorting domain-containing protein, partial [Rhodocytophaga aerolata]